MNIFRTITNYLQKLLNIRGVSKKPVLIVYGARQVGKTTLVKYLLEQYPNHASYFNCDYTDVQETFSYHNSHKLDTVVRNLELIIIDEAQRIPHVGLVLKILVDNYPNLQVIATGSSSFDLANKISEPLTGRKIVSLLLPVSFEELYANLHPLEQKRKLENLMLFGSYPEVVSLEKNAAITKLKDITGSYLFKDILSLHQLRKPEIITKLLQLLALQISNEVSFHEIAQQLGIDQVSVQKYIYLLEETFVIFRLSAFKRNLRGEISKSRKIYFYDLGIRNTLIQNFNNLDIRNDVGQLWENFCIVERLKYNNNHQQELNKYFWRTYAKQEIDYIEEYGGKLYAYEFKWGRNKPKQPSEFLETYPNSIFTLITPDNFYDFVTKPY